MSHIAAELPGRYCLAHSVPAQADLGVQAPGLGVRGTSKVHRVWESHGDGRAQGSFEVFFFT